MNHLTLKIKLILQNIGPFTQTLNRAKAIDFSSSIGVTTHYTIIVPLGFKDNLLSVTDPLSLEVWICFIICIPVYISIIVSLNYVYSGTTKWGAAASSVIRGALSERRTALPPKHLYQKCLILVWSSMMLVLTTAYKGNLLAMITKPTMNIPFRDADSMVEQTQIQWGVWHHGILGSYAKSKSPGTTMRKIMDRGIEFTNDEVWADDCYTSAAKKSGDIATICDISSAINVVTKDFSKTGTCNYYLTDDHILATGNALAFQVCKAIQ